MSTLYGNNISQTYQGLIKLANSTTGVTATTQSLQDGLGNNIPIQVSTTQVNISGSFFINNVPITNGTSGTSGTSGVNGSSGTSGQSGSSGSTGSGGTSGTSGTSGGTGSSGTSGSNGSSGTSGTSGSAGTSGTSQIVDTGSFATTGSNTFIGSQIIQGNVSFPSNSFVSTDNVSGSLYLSSLNQGTLFINADGGEGDVIIGYSAWQNNLKVKGGNTEITGSLGVTNIKGTGSLYLQPNQSDVRYLEIYNTSPTDTHITASGGQIFLGDDVTYVKVDNYGSTNRIDIVAGNELNVSSSIVKVTGSLLVSGSVDITGQYLINGAPIPTGSSGDRNGLITTGSIVGTQSITGSLILSGSAGIELDIKGDTTISGSLITNTANNGLIKVQSELHSTSSLVTPYGYISSSNPTSQTNIIFNTILTSSGSGLLTTQSGSIVISGSNNIILNSNRNNTLLTAGTYGYIGGNNNIGPTIPTLGTGSILRPTISNNALQGALSLQFTTSSLAAPTIASNLIYGTTTINHQSGSLSLQGNYIGINAFTSNANTTTLGLNPTFFANVIAGTTSPQLTLNHNSSSINYQGNIGGGLTVTNNYSSSVSTAVNNATVTGNILGGQSNTLVISGSNTSNRRTFDSNVVIGRSNVINSQQSGSSAGHLISTAILGDNLIVSASHTSTTAGGTVIVGRFNATGSLQESSQDAVFVVGTGTGAINRRNAIHVDSNNNTRITGSLLVSGSLSINGNNLGGTLITSGTFGNSQTISGSLLVQANPAAGQAPGLVIQTWNETALAAVITGSVNITGSLVLNGTAITSVDRNGLITTGSNASANQYYTGSLIISSSADFNRAGISVQSGESEGRINAAGGPWLYRNVLTRNTVVGEVAGTNVSTPFLSGSETNLIFTGFLLGFTSGSQNTVIAGGGGANFRSGSQNTIIGTPGNLQYGNGNLLIGNPRTSNFMEGVISIGTSTSPDLLYKSGSVVQMGYSTQITGSLDVSSNTILSSSLKILGDVQFSSGSNKTMGTVALDGANPGVATVSNSLVTTNSLIFLTKQTNNHPNAGPVVVSSKGTGTFTITSNHNSDTDVVAYQIINPA